jgi:hypothetical protein
MIGMELVFGESLGSQIMVHWSRVLLSNYVINVDWNWDLIPNRLSDYIYNLIDKLKGQTNGNSEIPNWDLSTNENFSLKQLTILLVD